MWQLNLPRSERRLYHCPAMGTWSAGDTGTAVSLPARFPCGTATAGHRTEGGSVENDWWAGEHTPGTECVDSSGTAANSLAVGARPWPPSPGSGSALTASRNEWSRIESAEGRLAFTLNEPNVLAFMAHVLGKFPPGLRTSSAIAERSNRSSLPPCGCGRFCGRFLATPPWV
jgi:hypothetical protein